MEDGEEDKPQEGKSIIGVNFTDFFGLSKSAAELRKASENVLKSLEKGIGKLSEPVTTILQAKADEKSLVIRGDAEIEIIKKKIDLYSTFVKTIETSGGSRELIELAHRSYSREALEGIERQGVREKVGHYLLEELHNINNEEVIDRAIDSDWLTLFWDTVEKKSSEDIQRIYAKILAGECLRPGSFSSRLLHILSIMTQKDAMAFETICNMSIRDEGGTFLIEPLEEFENFLQNEITSHEELGDYVIEDLESLGLLGRSSMIAFHEEEDGTEKDIGGVRCTIIVTDGELLATNQNYITGIPFTMPAEELRSIISLTQNKPYFYALKSFTAEHLGIELRPNNESKAHNK